MTSTDRRTRHSSSSILRSQITATVSVTLVLLMLGIVALSAVAAHTVAQGVELEVGFTVVMTDSVKPAQANSLGAELRSRPYAAEVRYVSAEQVLSRWNSMLGTEGDTLLGDTNPFLAEWEVKVRRPWSRPDSLEAIAAALRHIDIVEEVSCRSDVARAVDDTLSTLQIIFLCVSGVLAVISFVLISNTVQLTVHERRHTIHAMRLVGATGGFIRRPFVMAGLLSGLTAATIASVILGALWGYLQQIYPVIADLIWWQELLAVTGGIYAAGALICTLAALVAANRYLRRPADRLYD